MLTHRVLYSDDGTLTDFSLEAKSGGFDAVMVAAEDYIYIGQKFPFNSLYLDIGTANSNASVLGIDYWTSTSWESVVDILDSTSSSGVTLAQSGIVRFSVNEETAWNFVDNTADEAQSGLSDVTIYNQYWIRLKVSADLSASTAINKVTYLFTNDDTVAGIDPDINEFLTSWASGKTTWLEQELIASKHVVVDLMRKNLLKNHAQILQIDELLELATAYRTLGTIYTGLGEKYIPQREEALKQYKSIVDGMVPIIDLDGDAHIDRGETRVFSNNEVQR